MLGAFVLNQKSVGAKVDVVDGQLINRLKSIRFRITSSFASRGPDCQVKTHNCFVTHNVTLGADMFC